MNFSINNLNGTNANISSMISQLVARKSSSLSSLIDQQNAIQSTMSALQNFSQGGSINSSYSSQISSLQDMIDRLKNQYTINSNKLSTVNNLKTSYNKTVSTLDDYIESLKNPVNTNSSLTATSTNTNVADVTLNGTSKPQSLNLNVTQLATCSTLTSSKIKGASVTGSTKITDLFSGMYDTTTNTITSLRTDLSGDMKLSDLGVTSGAFKLGARVISVDENDTLNDLMSKINADSNYTAQIDADTGAFTISATAGTSIGITNAVGDLTVKGDIGLDTKLVDIGLKTGAYFVGDSQVNVTSSDTVSSLIDKVEALGYQASLATDPSNPSGKVLNITDGSGNAVSTKASNFASLAGFTVSVGTFSINGHTFNIESNTTIDDLVFEINKATADNVGAAFKDGKIILTASETGAVAINVEKGSSNFTNAIGFTQGGTMNTGNYVVGSEGSFATLKGVNNSVEASAVAGSSTLTGTKIVATEYMTLEEAQAQGYTIINSEEEFISLINANGRYGSKFYLNTDLTIDYDTHGNITTRFEGTLEGNGHSITYTGPKALFDLVGDYNSANTATFSNITLDDCYITDGNSILVNTAEYVVFSNVNVNDSTIITNNAGPAGALVANAQVVTASNIDIDGLYIYSPYVGSVVGGLIGKATGNVNITDAELSRINLVSGGAAAGLVGDTGTASAVRSFKDIYVSGQISGSEVYSLSGGDLTNATCENIFVDTNSGSVAGNSAIFYTPTSTYTPATTYDPTATSITTPISMTTASIEPTETSSVYYDTDMFSLSQFETNTKRRLSTYGTDDERLVTTTIHAGTFVINGVEINLSDGDVLSAIDEINAQSSTTGVVASIVDDRVTLTSIDGSAISCSKGTSNFGSVVGLIYETPSFTEGTFVVSYSKIDANGNPTNEMLSTTIEVAFDDTVDDVIEKIKNQTVQTWTDSEGNEQTTYLQAEIVNGTFQIRQSVLGAGYNISVTAGSSDFTNYVGLTTEVSQGTSIAGTSTTYTGINEVDFDTAFTAGSFSITATSENTPGVTETRVITVEDGETLESVIEKINSCGLAVSAGLVEQSDGTYRLQISHNNQGKDYSISVSAGSTDFTEKVGFTTATNITVSGSDSSYSYLTGVTSGLSVSDSGYTEGSFVVKSTILTDDGASASTIMAEATINVTSSMTMQDVLDQITNATYVDGDGVEHSLGLSASLTADGKIKIQQTNSGEGFDIEVVVGSTDFTEKVGLTQTVTVAVTNQGKQAELVGDSAFTVTDRNETGTTFTDNYSFSAGNFTIKCGATGYETRHTIEVEEGDSLQDVVNKINSADIGVTASINADGKLSITANVTSPDYNIVVESGTSDFLAQAGLATEMQNVGVLSNGTLEAQFSSVTGTNQIKAEYMTLDEAIAQGYTVINSAEDFVNLIGASPDGKFYLNADITLDSSYNDVKFYGVFEGNGHTITMDDVQTRALFSESSALNCDIEVRNLNITGLMRSFTSNSTRGILYSLIDSVNLTLDNINIVDFTFGTSNGGNFGALVGDALSSTINATNIDVDNLYVNISGATQYTGALFGYLNNTKINLDNIEVLDLDINVSDTLSGSVGGLFGKTNVSGHVLNNVYVDGFVYGGASKYALGQSCISDCFTNNVFLDLRGASLITESYSPTSSSMVYTNQNYSGVVDVMDESSLNQLASSKISNFGETNETITQITEGSFEINGVTINLSGGDLSDAIAEINAHSTETGVKALVVDGKLQLRATTTGNKAIYVDGGTSNFGEVTGLTTKSVGGGVALGKEAVMNLVTGSKTVKTEYMTLEEARAQDYTIINSEEEFISLINPGGAVGCKFYLNTDLTIDYNTHGNITTQFVGTLEGNGHSITYTGPKALFESVDSAVFNNINIQNSCISVNAAVNSTGILVGSAVGNLYLTNVNVIDSEVNLASGASAIGFLVGDAEVLRVNKVDIINSTISGTLGSYRGNIGSIAGSVGDIYATDVRIDNVNLDINGSGGNASGLVGSVTSGWSLNKVYINAEITDSFGNYTLNKLLSYSGVNHPSLYHSEHVFLDVTSSSEFALSPVSINVYDRSEMSESLWVQASATGNLASKATNESLTQISAGSVVINGTTINLSAGSINDAIAQINAKTSETGVTAKIVDNKVQFSSFSAFTIAEGTSDFVEKTGTAGYVMESANNLLVSSSSFEKINSVSQAEAMGYTCVYTAKELMTALSEKKNVLLMQDIDFAGYTTDHGTANYSGILNGNGYSIKNYSIASAIIDGVSGTATIKNLTIDNANVTTTAQALLVGNVSNYSSVSFDNINVEDTTFSTSAQDFISLFIGGNGSTHMRLNLSYKDINITRTTVDATGTGFNSGDYATTMTYSVGFLASSLWESTFLIDGVTIDSSSTIKSADHGDIGSLYGTDYNSVVDIKNTIVENKIDLAYDATVDYNPYTNVGGMFGNARSTSSVNIRDSFAGAKLTGTYVNADTLTSYGVYGGGTYSVKNSYHGAFYNSIETINGSTKSGASIVSSLLGAKTTNSIYKSQLNAEQATKYGYTLINSAQELFDKINANKSGKFILMNDIDLTGYTDGISNFAGELNGNGFTIKNKNNSLFSSTQDGAVIKNLKTDNIDSALIRFAYDSITIDNVDVTNSYIYGSSTPTGSLICEASTTGAVDNVNLIINNVNVSNTEVEAEVAGGLIGKISYNSGTANVIVKNVTVEAEIKAVESAGIVSNLENTTSGKNIFDNIYIASDFVGTDSYVGGIITKTNVQTVTLSNSIIAGCLSGTFSSAWSLIVTTNGAATVQNCISSPTWNGSSSDAIIAEAVAKRDYNQDSYHTYTAFNLTISGETGTATINVQDGWTNADLANAINNSGTGVSMYLDGDFYTIANYTALTPSDMGAINLTGDHLIASSMTGLSLDSKIDGLTDGTFLIYDDEGNTIEINISSTDTVQDILNKLADSCMATLDAEGRFLVLQASGYSIGKGTSNFDDIFYSRDFLNPASSTTHSALVGTENITGSEVIDGSFTIHVGGESETFTINSCSMKYCINQINNSGIVTASIQDGKLVLMSNDTESMANVAVEVHSGNFGSVAGVTTIAPNQGVSVVGHEGSYTTLTGSKKVNSGMSIDEARAAGYVIVNTELQLAQAIQNNKNIFLAKNITLTGDAVLGSGVDIYGLDYSGVLDGNGHTITATSSETSGLFNNLTGTVKNLNLSGFDVNSNDGLTNYLGILANRATHATVQNVTLSDSMLYAINPVQYGGLLFGAMNNSTIDNVKIDETVKVDGVFSYPFAGVAGNAMGTTIVTNIDLKYNVLGGFSYTGLPSSAVIGRLSNNYLAHINNINVAIDQDSVYGLSSVVTSSEGGTFIASNIWIDQTNSDYNHGIGGNSQFSLSDIYILSDEDVVLKGFNCNELSELQFQTQKQSFYKNSIAQVTAGTVNVNGLEITLSGGNLNTAISEINSYSAQTGVKAYLNNGVVSFKNTEMNSIGITVSDGTSNFVELTGTAGYSIFSPIPTGKNTQGSKLTSTNAVQSTHYTQEQAEALGYNWITTAEQFAAMSGSSDKFMLGCDLDLSGITRLSTFNGVLDGNGFSITATPSLGLIKTATDVTIRNLKIENIYLRNNALIDTAKGSLTMENIEVVGADTQNAVLVNKISSLSETDPGDIIFDNIRIKDSNLRLTGGALAGTVNTNGVVKVNNVEIDGLTISSTSTTAKIGALFGTLNAHTTITNTKVHNTAITANSSAIVGGLVGSLNTTKSSSYTYGQDITLNTYNTVVSVDMSNAGTFSQFVGNVSSVSGSINAYNTYYDSTKATGATEVGTASNDISSLGIISYDELWSAKGIAKKASQAKAEGYTCIYTASEFVSAITNNLDGKFMLMNNIDLTGIDLNGGINGFSGILDGNGYSIKNYTSTVGGSLFENVEDSGAIKNLDLRNFNISGGNSSAALVSHVWDNASLSIENVKLFDSNIQGVTYAAGLVSTMGSGSSLDVNNVRVDYSNLIIADGTGGIAGGVLASSGSGGTYASFRNVDVDLLEMSGVLATGGIAGKISYSVFVDNVHSYVLQHDSSSKAGCLFGYVDSTVGASVVVKNSYLDASNLDKGIDYAGYVAGTFSLGVVNNCMLDNLGDADMLWSSTVNGLYYNITASEYDFDEALSLAEINREYYNTIPVGVIRFYNGYSMGGSNYDSVYIDSYSSIQSVVAQINANTNYGAYIDSENKLNFEVSSFSSLYPTDGFGVILPSSSLFAADFDLTNYYKNTSIISGMTETTTLRDLTGNEYFEGTYLNGLVYDSATTIGEIINNINSAGHNAYLDADGNLFIYTTDAQASSLFDSQLSGLFGFSNFTYENSAKLDLGEESVQSSMTGTVDITPDTLVAAGDFIIDYAGDSTTYTVTQGMTMQDVVDMINRDDPNLSAEIKDNKIYLYDVNGLYERITITDGTSNFAELAGFTYGNEQSMAQVVGQNAVLESLNTASASDGKYTTGTFVLNLTDFDGNIVESETFTISQGDTIQQIVNDINYSSLGVSAKIDENTGKIVIERDDSSTGGNITFTKGTSDFTNVVGFTSGGVQEVELQQGALAQITSTKTATYKTFSEGNFVVDFLDNDGNVTASKVIEVAEGASALDIVSAINDDESDGLSAYIDKNTDKLVIVRDKDTGEGYLQIRKGTSDFTNVLGFTTGGSSTGEFVDGVTSSVKSTYSASNSQRFTEGNFVISLTGDNAGQILVDVSATDSIYMVAQKINELDGGVHAYVDDNNKLVIERDADKGVGGIEIIAGTSSIARDLGFVTGGVEYGSLSQAGSTSKIVSVFNYQSVANSYSAGNFYIQLVNETGVATGNMIEININENNGVVDDINSVIATINSKNAGISASLDAEGRLVIQKDQTAETGGFKIIKGTSDFTDKFGFTTGGNAVNNTFVEGANKSSTVLESQDLNSKLASDSAQLSTAGVTDGTFKINGVNINVSASDTLSDLAYKINTIFSADEYSHIGISASVSNGELLISTTKPDVSIDIEKGSSNFTEIAGLTKDYFNSSDLGITQGGQNAHFSINGRDYDMALSLNNDGENMIYLDTNGQVVTSEDDAVIKINVKDIGSTVIEIGRTALDDSIQKLQTFINRFNAAMNSSSNSILANDAAFSALINQIKSALTDDVGSIYNVKNALAEIGIVISVSGSTYSDAGNIRMSLSKTNGEYDYVEAFYQDPQKVLDLLIGDDTQPLDYSCAGVFTRLSDVLHNALEDTRSGYFKVTPRAIESQQKALNNEITSLTFDLNELQNSLAGTDYGIGTGSGAGGSNDAYLAILEAQYQMISEAINSLNSQYNSSLVRLILNQNNASFNPIV